MGWQGPPAYPELRLNYYKNMKIHRHTTWLPSYRHKTFPTQIFRKLLNVSHVTAARRSIEFIPINLQGPREPRESSITVSVP
jgi:hypothetical protein